MKTLREKIEALTRFANGPRSVEFVKLYDVLRIVAEHEQALSGQWLSRFCRRTQKMTG